jgi:hypothetical protein
MTDEESPIVGAMVPTTHDECTLHCTPRGLAARVDVEYASA